MIEKTPMIDKRISTYLCELVLDQTKMEEYWRDPKEALAKSGLTPAQQEILLSQDHAAIGQAMLSENSKLPQPVGSEFYYHSPEFLPPSPRPS